MKYLLFIPLFLVITGFSGCEGGKSSTGYTITTGDNSPVCINDADAEDDIAAEGNGCGNPTTTTTTVPVE